MMMLILLETTKYWPTSAIHWSVSQNIVLTPADFVSHQLLGEGLVLVRTLWYCVSLLEYFLVYWGLKSEGWFLLWNFVTFYNLTQETFLIMSWIHRTRQILECTLSGSRVTPGATNLSVGDIVEGAPMRRNLTPWSPQHPGLGPHPAWEHVSMNLIPQHCVQIC